MAPTPTRKKAEASLEKGGIIGSRYSRRPPRRKRSEPRRRPATYQSTDTQKLLHRLLNVGKHNQGIEGRKLNLSQAQWLQNLLRKYQEHLESSRDKDKTDRSDNSASESECSVAVSPAEMMEVANSSRSTSSRSTVSNTSQRDSVGQSMTLAQSIENMRSLLKKEPVVQIINSCFKAGLEEGKRRAKKYVQHVLSFGLSTGYLIPGDVGARANRLSPRVLESKRADAESRLRRRRARRGEDLPANVKRKDLRRGTGTSTSAKSKAPGADLTEVATAGKSRGRKSKSSSPKTSPAQQGTSRSEKTSARQGRNGERAARRKSMEKKRSQHKRARNPRKSTSNNRRSRSKSRRDRTSENPAGVKLPANETNERMTGERVRSASRSKSVPTPRRRGTPRDNVKGSLAGACYECDDCRIIRNDA